MNEDQPFISDSELFVTSENEMYSESPSIDTVKSSSEIPFEDEDVTTIQDSAYDTPDMALDDESLELAAAALPKNHTVAPASDDLPDWLKSMNNPIEDSTAAPPAPTESNPAPTLESTPNAPSTKSKVTPKKFTPKKPAIETLIPTVNTDDLPDWLK